MFKLLLVLERVHAGPEAVVEIPDQLSISHQSLERLGHEFLGLVNVIEYLLSEGEKPPVDSQGPAVDRMYARDQAG